MPAHVRPHVRLAVPVSCCQYQLTALPLSTYLDTVDDKETRRAASLAANANPEVGLRSVWALRRLCDQLEKVQVANARKRGWTWQQIADELNVTRQAVHKRYAHQLEGEGD